MDRKLFGLFSGTHLIAAFAIAALAPSALFAAVTFSNVAVVNPGTGVAASVDSAGRLTAINPYSFYRDYGANIVDITIGNNGVQCEMSQQYVVPAGKALIVTAISGYEQQADQFPIARFFLYAGANCSGPIITSHASEVTTNASVAPVAVDFGVGIPVPAGSTVSLYSSENYGMTFIHGYLVPAAWVRPDQVITSAAPLVRPKASAPRI